MTVREAASRAWLEAVIYLRHVGALFWPGMHPGAFEIHPGRVDEISDWDPTDLRLLIDEGRTQLARQREDFRQIQVRAQWLFTVAVGLLGLLITTMPTLPDDVSLAVWLGGVLAVALSVLGAGAAMTVRGEFAMVDASLLSHVRDAKLVHVARAYASGVAVGENTVATRLTVLRDAVFLVLLGGTINACAWVTGA